MSEKKKILMLADHPFTPSGVGTQTRYVCEALLRTGRYSLICLGGAVRHENYEPIKTHEWGDDFVIFPVDGYGNQDTIRAMLRSHRPDLVWFMTDPRFWTWLWKIDNEIRAHVPMLYYHVWDNYPPPMFNKPYYNSNDVICTISQVTDNIVRKVAPEVETVHIPHAVNLDVFKPLEKDKVQSFREQSLKEHKDKMIFFWNNRNARRKQSGTLIFWFKEFLDKVGHDKATLIMHTDPKDVHGQDLNQIMAYLGLNDGQILISNMKIPPEQLAMVYNSVDCTINISDAEGFGLGTLESLSCGTPIIVNMTGGLQEQVTDGENWFGIGIHPISKSVIGSQDVPYIYEDRLSKEQFVEALTRFYNLSNEEREQLGEFGREHVLKNYNFEKFRSNWVNIIDKTIEKHGSWNDRKTYKPYTFMEIE